ncbi:MerR family transcriptional regulator [Sphingomonas oligophenolica]|uniref:MerR family transcriptional regulator n=1 Tax=Sphingomonas oligophenolica TaxID=301154 RepID=A0A502CN38_9SPHN|nr:MerR family transcriptional regulator [Sphingomonas oligophenolica]TPG13559.1 MerR family transcriptional regulator [Sphingomonas oligophenolica]
MADGSSKTSEAFRTIGELSRDTGIAQHILRYWETRFPQLRPITRAGNRRYYRPEDIALVRRIDSLLNQRGFTIKGAQQTLADEGVGRTVTASTPLVAIRDQLARALAED